MVSSAPADARVRGSKEKMRGPASSAQRRPGARPVSSRVVRPFFTRSAKLQCARTDEVLCVLHNDTRESWGVRIVALATAGESFLRGVDVDLEPNGRASFIATIENRVSIATPFCLLSLVLRAGEPILFPTAGIEQACHRGTHPAAPAWILTVSVWTTSQSLPASHPLINSVKDLLSKEAALFSQQWQLLLSTRAAPEECTVLAVHDTGVPAELAELVRQHGLEHFIVPCALFLRGDGDEIVHSLDGAAVVLNTDSEGEPRAEIAAHGPWPALSLSVSSAVHRTNVLWHVCYVFVSLRARDTMPPR